jgi:hypothetical protein
VRRGERDIDLGPTGFRLQKFLQGSPREGPEFAP